MRTLLVSSLLLLCLVGCKGGPSEKDLIGRWSGAPKLPESDKDNPMGKMGEAMLSMFTFDLELKEKNKFTMTVMIIPIEGDWTLSGNTVTLEPKTVMGLTPEKFAEQQKKNNPGSMASTNQVDKPIRLEIQPDGKTMKALDDIGGEKSEGELIFTKK